MAHRIEIGLKRGVPDPRGNFVRQQAKDLLGIALKRCATRDVYKIGLDLNRRRLAEVRRAFTDPVIALARTLIPASIGVPPPSLPIDETAPATAVRVAAEIGRAHV